MSVSAFFGILAHKNENNEMNFFAEKNKRHDVSIIGRKRPTF